MARSEAQIMQPKEVMERELAPEAFLDAYVGSRFKGEDSTTVEPVVSSDYDPSDLEELQPEEFEYLHTFILHSEVGGFDKELVDAYQKLREFNLIYKSSQKPEELENLYLHQGLGLRDLLDQVEDELKVGDELKHPDDVIVDDEILVMPPGEGDEHSIGERESEGVKEEFRKRNKYFVEYLTEKGLSYSVRIGKRQVGRKKITYEYIIYILEDTQSEEDNPSDSLVEICEKFDNATYVSRKVKDGKGTWRELAIKNKKQLLADNPDTATKISWPASNSPEDWIKKMEDVLGADLSLGELRELMKQGGGIGALHKSKLYEEKPSGWVTAEEIKTTLEQTLKNMPVSLQNFIYAMGTSLVDKGVITEGNFGHMKASGKRYDTIVFSASAQALILEKAKTIDAMLERFPEPESGALNLREMSRELIGAYAGQLRISPRLVASQLKRIITDVLRLPLGSKDYKACKTRRGTEWFAYYVGKEAQKKVYKKFYLWYENLRNLGLASVDDRTMVGLAREISNELETSLVMARRFIKLNLDGDDPRYRKLTKSEKGFRSDKYMNKEYAKEIFDLARTKYKKRA